MTRADGTRQLSIAWQWLGQPVVACGLLITWTPLLQLAEIVGMPSCCVISLIEWIRVSGLHCYWSCRRSLTTCHHRKTLPCSLLDYKGCTGSCPFSICEWYATHRFTRNAKYFVLNLHDRTSEIYVGNPHYYIMSGVALGEMSREMELKTSRSIRAVLRAVWRKGMSQIWEWLTG